jgi:LacI family transcriptional regulator
VIINDDQRGYQGAAVLDRLMNGHPSPAETVFIEPSGVACRASTDILALNDEVLAAAVRFIRDHASEQIGIDDVVDAVPLSRSVLQRRFRKAIGRTINEEITRLRLNRAVQLLSETSLELKAVALKAGFGTPSYMGAVFRQKLGRTPGSYRATEPTTTVAANAPRT